MAAYATDVELEMFMGATAPADTNRLLERASELIDDNIYTAVYAVDEHGLPTDSDIITAFSEATCAQVEFWLAADEEDDILGPVDALTLGPLKVNYSQSGGSRVSPTYLAPRAARILRNANLYSGEPVRL